jgi:molecular chaperone DnaK
MCYQLEKLMKEHADKIGEPDKVPLQKAIEKVRSVAKSDDVAAIKSAVSDLEQASHAFSKMLYEKQTSGGHAGPTDGGKPGGDGGTQDDAIDAEFEVKK